MFRPSRKTYFVSKININENEKLKNEIEAMFDDPNTYLTLPNESEYKYVIGKQIRGPRYDKNNELIPYTYVGKPFQIKKKKIETKVQLKRKFSISIRKPSKIEFKIEDLNHDEYMSSHQLESIFKNYRKKIKDNKETKHNSFIKDLPKILNDSVKKNLLIQEKTLENKVEMDNYREAFKKRLENKNKRKEKNILLLTTDNYREKREIHEFLNKNDEVGQFGNSLQNWTISLRKPKKFRGTRNGFYNCGNDKRPYWAIYNESFPIVTETIKKPSSLNLNFPDGFIRNVNEGDFANTWDQFLMSSTNLKELEIQGKDLLQFENENLRQLKGKKKLIKIHYDRDSTKDHIYCNTWKYHGYNTLSETIFN